MNSHYSILFKKQLKEKMFIQVQFRHQFPPPIFDLGLAEYLEVNATHLKTEIRLS